MENKTRIPYAITGTDFKSSGRWIGNGEGEAEVLSAEFYSVLLTTTAIVSQSFPR